MFARVFRDIQDLIKNFTPDSDRLRVREYPNRVERTDTYFRLFLIHRRV